MLLRDPGMLILSSLKFSAEALCFAARRAHLSTDHVAVLQLEAIQLCKGPGATGRSHKGPSKRFFSNGNRKIYENLQIHPASSCIISSKPPTHKRHDGSPPHQCLGVVRRRARGGENHGHGETSPSGPASRSTPHLWQKPGCEALNLRGFLSLPDLSLQRPWRETRLASEVIANRNSHSHPETGVSCIKDKYCTWYLKSGCHCTFYMSKWHEIITKVISRKFRSHSQKGLQNISKRGLSARGHQCLFWCPGHPNIPRDFHWQVIDKSPIPRSLIPGGFKKVTPCHGRLLGCLRSGSKSERCLWSKTRQTSDKWQQKEVVTTVISNCQIKIRDQWIWHLWQLEMARLVSVVKCRMFQIVLRSPVTKKRNLWKPMKPMKTWNGELRTLTNCELSELSAKGVNFKNYTSELSGYLSPGFETLKPDTSSDVFVADGLRAPQLRRKLQRRSARSRGSGPPDRELLNVLLL